MDFVIVTGMSGAGKTTAMAALEDLGYFCVDNVPPSLLGKFVELCQNGGKHGSKMAVGVDARSPSAFGDVGQVLGELTQQKVPLRILFLDASNQVLLNRYKETRRCHPLLGGQAESIKAAIALERQVMEPIRRLTQYVVDSSITTVKQLHQQISDLFSTGEPGRLTVQCMSFGFKYGLPMEPDIVFDVRCLPNPFYIPQLREKTGLNQEVQDYVLGTEESRMLLKKLEDLFDFTYPLYEKEGKNRLVIAIGCTGGRHRSVTFVEALAAHLEEQGVPVVRSHRDKDR